MFVTRHLPHQTLPLLSATSMIPFFSHCSHGTEGLIAWSLGQHSLSYKKYNRPVGKSPTLGLLRRQFFEKWSYPCCLALSWWLRAALLSQDTGGRRGWDRGSTCKSKSWDRIKVGRGVKKADKVSLTISIYERVST